MSSHHSRVITSDNPELHAVDIPVGATVARMSDNQLADFTAQLLGGAVPTLVGGATQIATLAPCMGSAAQFGVTVGMAGGPIGAVAGLFLGAICGGLLAFGAGKAAEKMTNAVQRHYDLDLETMLAGIHWGIHVGNGKIVEYLDDSHLHIAYLTNQSWDRPVAIIKTGSQVVAANAENRFLLDSEGEYSLYTNNCRHFCRRCW